MDTPRTLADRMAQALAFSGITQSEAGRRAKLSRSLISKYKSGEVLTMEADTARRLGKALGVRSEYLLLIDDEMPFWQLPRRSQTLPPTVLLAGGEIWRAHIFESARGDVSDTAELVGVESIPWGNDQKFKRPITWGVALLQAGRRYLGGDRVGGLKSATDTLGEVRAAKEAKLARDTAQRDAERLARLPFTAEEVEEFRARLQDPDLLKRYQAAAELPKRPAKGTASLAPLLVAMISPSIDAGYRLGAMDALKHMGAEAAAVLPQLRERVEELKSGYGQEVVASIDAAIKAVSPGAK